MMEITARNIRAILGISRHGIMTHRAVLDVISRNISNAETEGYTRQTPVLIALEHPRLGVLMNSIKRNRLMILESRMRTEIQDFNRSEATKKLLDRIETLFSEKQGTGLTDEISFFFDSLEKLSTDPEGIGIRQEVISAGQRLSEKLKFIANSLLNIRWDADKDVRFYIEKINELTVRIAYLNKRIAEVQAGGGNTSELKDKRDLALRELSEIVDIQSFEDELGRVVVSLRRGGHVLVERDRAFSMKAEADIDNRLNPLDPSSASLRKVVYVDGKGHEWDVTPFIISGKLAGALSIRDSLIPSLIDNLNTLARAFVENIGRTHSKGVGLNHFGELTSYQAESAADPIEIAGFPYSAEQGSFKIAVFSEDGTHIVSFQVDYDPSIDNLYSIADRINTNPENDGYVQATITADNKLKLEAEAGYTFDIYDDTGGLMTVLGLDVFLEGKDVFSIRVQDVFLEDPMRLGAAAEPGSSGDNRVALELAALKDEKVIQGKTFLEFYLEVQAKVGSAVVEERLNFEAKDMVVRALDTQIQEEAGVSLDEEFTKVIEFQRAFEASGRLVRVVDEMYLTILGFVG